MLALYASVDAPLWVRGQTGAWLDVLLWLFCKRLPVFVRSTCSRRRLWGGDAPSVFALLRFYSILTAACLLLLFYFVKITEVRMKRRYELTAVLHAQNTQRHDGAEFNMMYFLYCSILCTFYCWAIKKTFFCWPDSFSWSVNRCGFLRNKSIHAFFADGSIFFCCRGRNFLFVCSCELRLFVSASSWSSVWPARSTHSERLRQHNPDLIHGVFFNV